VAHAYPPTAWDPLKSLVKFTGRPFGGAAIIRMCSPNSIKDLTFILEVNINFCATISSASNKKSLENLWNERRDIITSQIANRVEGTASRKALTKDSYIWGSRHVKVQLCDKEILVDGVAHKAFGVKFVYAGPVDMHQPSIFDESSYESTSNPNMEGNRQRSSVVPKSD
jgi:hypothetical protein